MKLSKKYVKRIKKRLLACMSSIAICLVLVAVCNLAGFSMPVNLLKNSVNTQSTADETRLQNTDTVTYIYI